MDKPCLAAALDYAGFGWPVLPLHTPTTDGGCSCGKTGCSSPGKHPLTRNGLKDASTDEDAIRRWWEQWPRANVGVVTGSASGVIVLDVDGPEGMQTLKALPSLPDTCRTSTGAGAHYWFRHPGSSTVPTRTKLQPGLDLKADGGYVVAPPSVHRSGSGYCWRRGPDGVTLADPPPWLLALICAPATNGRTAPPRASEKLIEGNRNETALPPG